jgi:hypothetical protein
VPSSPLPRQQARSPRFGVLAGSGNTLVTFKHGEPGSYTSVLPITGLQVGERIAGIDYRYAPKLTTTIDPALMKLLAVGVTENGANDACVCTRSTGDRCGDAAQCRPATFDDGGPTRSPSNPNVDRIRVVGRCRRQRAPDRPTGRRDDTDLAPTGRGVNAIAYDRVDSDRRDRDDAATASRPRSARS